MSEPVPVITSDKIRIPRHYRRYSSKEILQEAVKLHPVNPEMVINDSLTKFRRWADAAMYLLTEESYISADEACLLMVIDYLNERTLGCWVDRKVLAEKLNTTPGRVTYLVRLLKKKTLVKVKRKVFHVQSGKLYEHLETDIRTDKELPDVN